MSHCIFLFHEPTTECRLVPQSWTRAKKCAWPANVKHIDTLMRMVKRRTPIGPGWLEYKGKPLKSNISFEKGLKLLSKAKKVMDTKDIPKPEDLQTTDHEQLGRHKRQNNRTRKSDLAEEKNSNKLLPLPVPPKSLLTKTSVKRKSGKLDCSVPNKKPKLSAVAGSKLTRPLVVKKKPLIAKTRTITSKSRVGESPSKESTSLENIHLVSNTLQIVPMDRQTNATFSQHNAQSSEDSMRNTADSKTRNTATASSMVQSPTTKDNGTLQMQIEMPDIFSLPYKAPYDLETTTSLLVPDSELLGSCSETMDTSKSFVNNAEGSKLPDSSLSDNDESIPQPSDVGKTYIHDGNSRQDMHSEKRPIIERSVREKLDALSMEEKVNYSLHVMLETREIVKDIQQKQLELESRSSSIETNDALQHLPCTTIQEVKSLNLQLCSDLTFQNKWVSALKRYTHSNVRNCVKSLLEKCLTLEVKTQLNWFGGGQKTKEAFSKTKIANLIIDLTLQACNKSTKMEIVEEVKQVLKRAPETFRTRNKASKGSQRTKKSSTPIAADPSTSGSSPKNNVQVSDTEERIEGVLQDLDATSSSSNYSEEEEDEEDEDFEEEL